MKSSPAFQFYPQDFLVGTADLTSEEVGGYIRLLCYQWSKGGLPKDDKKLMQLSGITDPYVLGNVSVKFDLCKDGLLRNERLEMVRKNQNYFHEKQSQNGKLGGNPNFKKGETNPYYVDYKPVAKDNPPDNPKINPSPSSSSSSSTSTISLKKKAALTDNEFLESLKSNPAYHGIDVQAQLSKMDAWLLVNPGRQKTRKFIVAWLNRCDKPLAVSDQASAKPSYSFDFLDKNKKPQIP